MEIFIGLGSALWLGILTSISPCPLATNIAAVSFLSKKIVRPQLIFLSGMAYTLGRMFAYAILGFVILSSMISVFSVANFLQGYMNKIFGPILIVIGLFLLDFLKWNFAKFSLSLERQNKLAESGFLGSFVLGVIFALSFCPISAALFFGSLMTLSLKHNFGIIFPFIYGIGTGLPVFVFAVCIALGLRSFAAWFKQIFRFEFIMRKLTGVIFMVVGAYYTIVYFLKIF